MIFYRSSDECSSEEIIDPNMKDPVDWVLKGKLSGLPRQQSNVVKIFISSTNEGIINQENELIQNKKILRHCNIYAKHLVSTPILKVHSSLVVSKSSI